MYNLYREPWLIKKLDTMLGDVFGGRPARPPGRDEQRHPRGGSGGRCARRRAAARRPRRPGARTLASPSRDPATDDWPFLYLRIAQLAPVLPRRARRSSSSSPLLAVLGAARVTRTSDPPLQPAFLRPRHRVPAARDEEPRVVQPAVRDDLGRQRAGVLRDPGQRAAGDPRQRAAPAAQPGTVLRRRSSSRSRSRISCRPTRC